MAAIGVTRGTFVMPTKVGIHDFSFSHVRKAWMPVTSTGMTGRVPFTASGAGSE